MYAQSKRAFSRLDRRKAASMAVSVHQPRHQQLRAVADDAGTGIFGSDCGERAPVSLTVPSMITTAPAGITPDAPRRGSVMAYAPRMMIVSVITLHPSQFGTPEPTPPSNTAHDGSRCRAIGEIVHLYRSNAQIHSVDAARRPLRAFPGPSAHGLVLWGRPGSTFAVAPAFAGVAGFDMSDGASLPDESCE